MITVLLKTTCSAEKDIMKYGVHYGTVQLDELAGYDLVILEPENYTKQQVLNLSQSETKIIGYLSLSEVNPERWYYSKLKEIGFLGKNENWNSDYINLEDTRARSILLDQVAEQIIDKGFGGLFLDTVDGVAPYTERHHLQDEMLQIIKKLRSNLPDEYIIQNRGIFLLPKSNSYIDAVMVEDVATHYDFEKAEYQLRAKQDYMDHVSWIQSFADTLQKPIFLLDYAVEDGMKDQARQRLDTLGHPYFISNIQLNTLNTR